MELVWTTSNAADIQTRTSVRLAWKLGKMNDEALNILLIVPSVAVSLLNTLI
jgi:hypothetical protein